MTRWRACRIALLVIAGSPIATSGQSADLAVAVRAIDIGQGVRIDAQRLGLVEGRFLSANGTALVLDPGDGPVQVRLPDIDRLWVQLGFAAPTERSALSDIAGGGPWNRVAAGSLLS